LDDRQPDFLTDADRDELISSRTKADMRLEFLKAATGRLPSSARPKPIAAAAIGYFAVVAPRSAVICALAALVGWVVLRLGKSGGMHIGARFGLWRHAAPWLVGYVLTWSAAVLLPDRPGWMGEDMRNSLSLAADAWQWQAIRWALYYGYYAAVALALITILLLSLLAYLWRGDWPRFKGELTLTAVRRCVLSLSVVATLWLAVSLAVTPTLIDFAEQDFHSKIDYFRDVPAWLENVQHSIDEVAAEQRQPAP
jgi:hypothetical protein